MPIDSNIEGMAVIDRWHEIGTELEKLEQKRDDLLDERANLDQDLIAAANNADSGNLELASSEFMNELNEL